MTTAEKTLKWWNDYLEQNKTYPLIAEIEMQLNLAVDNEKQVKNIEVIPCCESDSEQLPDVYLQELSKIEWMPQTQVSLNEQLQTLRQFANKLGLYDASDYLKK